MVRRLGFAGALVLLGLYACKADDPHPAAAGDPPQAGPLDRNGGGGGVANDNGTSGSTDDGGTITLADGAVVEASAGQCTDLTLTGLIVDEEADAQDPPAGTGGTIANGTYNLTQVNKYTGATGSVAGPTGVTYRSTIVITNGNTFARDVILASNTTANGATTGTEERSIGILVPVSPSLTITFNCPLQAQEQYTYTASSTSLILTNTVTRESYTYALKL